MKAKTLVGLAFFLSSVSTSCNNTLQCERIFLPKGYTGKVTIFFNQKNGQNHTDKEGCLEYTISDKGECFSALPFKVGTIYPNETFKYFEILSKDKFNQIFEFEENGYLVDTLANRDKKYVFFSGSGYSAPYYTCEYYIDYGKNYKNHLYR